MNLSKSQLFVTVFSEVFMPAFKCIHFAARIKQESWNLRKKGEKKIMYHCLMI